MYAKWSAWWLWPSSQKLSGKLYFIDSLSRPLVWCFELTRTQPKQNTEMRVTARDITLQTHMDDVTGTSSLCGFNPLTTNIVLLLQQYIWSEPEVNAVCSNKKKQTTEGGNVAPPTVFDMMFYVCENCIIPDWTIDHGSWKPCGALSLHTVRQFRSRKDSDCYCCVKCMCGFAHKMVICDHEKKERLHSLLPSSFLWVNKHPTVHPTATVCGMSVVCEWLFAVRTPLPSLFLLFLKHTHTH